MAVDTYRAKREHKRTNCYCDAYHWSISNGPHRRGPNCPGGLPAPGAGCGEVFESVYHTGKIATCQSNWQEYCKSEQDQLRLRAAGGEQMPRGQDLHGERRAGGEQ